MTPLKHPGLLSRREALKLFGLTAGAALTPGLLAGCAVDPVTGRQQLMIMTPAEEIALDRQHSPFQFSADYGVVQDQALNDYLNRVGRDLAARSHRPEMPFSFRAVNSPAVNAYAFPGGSIAATRGILVELASEAELAALLGHEIGHVNARHTAEQATKGTIASILVGGAALATSAAGLGDYSGTIQDLGGLGAGALLARYSRENEREADALGMEYMTRAGYTPMGMAALMEVLLKEGKRNPGALEMMFATHPMSEERHQTALRNAKGTYAALQNASDHRERYLDHTSRLRTIKGAIAALQNADTALRKKEYPAAEEELGKALAIAPDDYAALLMLAKCKMAREKAGEAERYARAATKTYPQEAQGHGILGLTCIVNRKYDQAFQQLSEYDRLLSGNPEIVFFQGLAQEGMQRNQEAARYYQRYLQKVKQGSRAQYAYKKLQGWGYLKQDR